jgi:hypothetical protein
VSGGRRSAKSRQLGALPPDPGSEGLETEDSTTATARRPPCGTFTRLSVGLQIEARRHHRFLTSKAGFSARASESGPVVAMVLSRRGTLTPKQRPSLESVDKLQDAFRPSPIRIGVCCRGGLRRPVARPSHLLSLASCLGIWLVEAPQSKQFVIRLRPRDTRIVIADPAIVTQVTARGWRTTYDRSEERVPTNLESWGYAGHRTEA